MAEQPGDPARPRPAAGPPEPDAVRILVVDDSAVVRGLITRILEAAPGLRVVATASDGAMAVAAVRRQAVDVVVLDIEMPGMDGLTALPLLLAASPRTRVVMASTLTRRNADISLQALAAGASDYLPKPSSARELQSADAFGRDLVAKVRALGAAARRAGPAAGPAPGTATAGPTSAGLASAGPARPAPPTALPTAAPRAAPSTRPMPPGFRADILAIGSSTGGPQALFKVLASLAGVTQPIVLTQHMPPTFTAILAEHIQRQCGLTAVEATDGMALAGGRCHVAPGDFHMVVERAAGGPTLRLTRTPPENFCRPAVDVMLRSVAAVYGRGTLSVILTGMGQDGLKGGRAVVEAGGVVIAQDEATSVVWGMPGAVAGAGLCSAVLPLPEIGPALRTLALRRAA